MTETNPQDPIVTLKAEVGLEEVAAIRVAEIEHGLLTNKEQARVDLDAIEKKVAELQSKVKDTVVADTLENYPALKEIEKMLKGQFPKHFSLAICLACDGKVKIEVEAGGDVPLKGEASKSLIKEIEAGKAQAAKIENQLVEIRTKLGQLPYLERAAKAAVAKARLEGSKEGRDVLRKIAGVSLPGLPAPKKG